MRRRKTHSSEAGFAIGAILMVVALIALLGMVIAAGNSDFTTAGTVDRIAADLSSQASVIRGRINQCNIEYLSALSLCVSGQPCSVSSGSDPYPSSAAGGTDVGALLCDPLGSHSLWTDMLVPHATSGMNNWTYINAAASNGGRCIWTTPTIASPSSNNGYVNGLSRAAKKFTNQTTCDNSGTLCSAEVIYDPASTSQKFVFWITMPTATPDSHCLP